MSDTGRFHGCCPDPTCPEHFPMSIPSSPILDFEKAEMESGCGLRLNVDVHASGLARKLEAQAQAAVSPLLAEIERLKGEVAEWERTADGTVLDAVRLSRVAVAEAQKLREALDGLLTQVAEDTACQHLDRDDPNRLDAAHQLGKALQKARKALGGSK